MGFLDFLDNRIGICKDSILFLYRFNWAQGHSTICTSSGYATIWMGEEEEEEDPEEESKEDPEEDLEEDFKEDPEEGPEEDPEKDPEEEVWEDHMEVSEMGSNIYNPRDGGVIDMSPEHGPEESLEYHPRPHYNVDDDDDDDDAPTWP
ncbi:proline-, glutamic acid- and leucine-rich protein 1-like [Solanum tuberosum]|uniref:proline-, glutamic acid- and leucine-rich protein 1-like n=1 Tax=Solanum tuberosum TaxID=4113 RepID=UPI00073A1049|nr:PREDICTED: proline-, glutamic acid- and leucine-rich protein 1-like [Solanum tuberosum]